MTPEAKNELVARWMGWKKFQDAHRNFWWDRIDVPGARPPFHYTYSPPYRTDPALNRELEVRLCEDFDWRFGCFSKGRWFCERPGNGGVANTLAEAVFAAAVIEASREGGVMADADMIAKLVDATRCAKRGAYANDERLTRAAFAIQDKLDRQHDEIARLTAELAASQERERVLREAVMRAYGYLWHVNNEPGTPQQYAPERAAYEARKVLRGLLTDEQRGKGINDARAALGEQESKDD